MNFIEKNNVQIQEQTSWQLPVYFNKNKNPKGKKRFRHIDYFGKRRLDMVKEHGRYSEYFRDDKLSIGPL